MKKVMAAIVLAMSLSLMACGNKNAEELSAQTETEANTGTETDTETEANTETGTEASTEETAGNEEIATADIIPDSESESTDTTEFTGTGDGEGMSDREANFTVDKKDYTEYGQKIKDVVAAKDMEGLTELIAFPVYLGIDEGVIVETREDFLAYGEDKIFTQEMLDSIAKADVESLTPSMAGFTLMGSTESVPGITFSMVGGELAISGINY